MCVVANASGCGKTTLARKLAGRIGAPFVELDALYHGAGWKPASAEAIRASVEAVVGGDSWVLDGACLRVLGTLVIDAADLVVWLDLPAGIWLPRLARRSFRRWWTEEELWNGNRQTLRGIVWGADSVLATAFRVHVRMRRELPALLASYPTVRLESRGEVRAFVNGFPGGQRIAGSHSGKRPLA